MKRSSDKELTDIAAELLHETSAAYLLDDGATKDWVAKSLVEANEDGTFTMPMWLAKQKGFI